MRPLYEEILLFCPDQPTGGPEALHQLAYAINRQGGDAKFIYCGPHLRLGIAGDIIRSDGAQAGLLKYYAHYAPRALAETRLRPHSLLIFPEPMIKLALSDAMAVTKRAIWWLSVDNAFVEEPRLRDAAFRRDLFAGRDILHFHQSDYARQFLAEAGIASQPLSDYTDPEFMRRSLNPAANPPIGERPDVICFFPTKGAALAKQFILQGNLRHPIELTPIINMTKPQVQNALFNARIYIDFGHHPGKDRVPREAASAGAVVLLHAKGAGACLADHPLDKLYRFTEADISSGRLHRLIDEILDHPQAHAEAQKNYRAAILREQEVFDGEVRRCFFADDQGAA